MRIDEATAWFIGILGTFENLLNNPIWISLSILFFRSGHFFFTFRAIKSRESSEEGGRRRLETYKNRIICLKGPLHIAVHSSLLPAQESSLRKIEEMAELMRFGFQNPEELIHPNNKK